MIAEFSVVPVGRGESLAGPVARVLDIVDKSGLPYQLTAMGTLVEGDWDEVLALVRRCHEAMRGEAGRVSTHIAIDDRPGASGRIVGKVRDVEESLGRPLKK
jgi:uncharacterized protein (TIGR00106 family)